MGRPRLLGYPHISDRSKKKRTGEEKKVIRLIERFEDQGLPPPQWFGVAEDDLLFALPAESIRMCYPDAASEFPGWLELREECRTATGAGPSDSVDWKNYADDHYGLPIASADGVRRVVRKLDLAAAPLPSIRRSLRQLGAARIAVVLLLVTVIPAKIIIARPSPGLGPVAPGGWGAFPSGHATTRSVCYVLAALLIAGRARRSGWAAGAMTLSFLIGIALVWRDFHWFTDVLAGWALAALIVLAALRLTSRPARLPEPHPRRLPGPQRSATPG